jgi:hypothetical protein
VWSGLHYIDEKQYEYSMVRDTTSSWEQACQIDVLF